MDMPDITIVMRAYILPVPIAVALGVVAILTAGCTENDKRADGHLPTRREQVASKEATPQTIQSDTVPMALTASTEASSAQWSDIKDCTYDARAQFFAGLKRLEAKVDEQIAELTAKRAAMNSATGTEDWDFAMKEMRDAQSYLKSVGVELSKANAETWNQQKDTVGRAWERTQAAYGKVKSSTTS